MSVSNKDVLASRALLGVFSGLGSVESQFSSDCPVCHAKSKLKITVLEDYKLDIVCESCGQRLHGVSVAPEAAPEQAPEINLPGPDDEVKPEEIPWAFLAAKSAASVDFENIPTPTMFVDGILTEGVYLLNAFSKVGKSRLLLQMLLSIARGEKFLERKTTQCDCLYLALEDLRIDYEGRLRAFCSLSGKPAPENLYTMTKEDFPRYITPTIGCGLEDVIQSNIAMHPDIRVIGIDVFSIIRSKTESRDFSRDERRDLDALLRLSAKLKIAIVVAHHTGKNGMTGAKTRTAPTGSGAGSYAVSGTVIGEMEIVKDQDDPDRATFRAGGRRTRMCELAIYSRYPAWELEGDAADIRERKRQAAETVKVDTIVAIAEYLVDRDGKWTGRVSDIMNAPDESGTLPAVYEKISTADMRSQQLADRLKAKGIRYRINARGTAGITFTFEKLEQQFQPEQTELPF